MLLEWWLQCFKPQIYCCVMYGNSEACVPQPAELWARVKEVPITKCFPRQFGRPALLMSEWSLYCTGQATGPGSTCCNFWGLLGASFSPSLYRRMKGLLYPYRFRSVVIRFFSSAFFFVCACVLSMGKQRTGTKYGLGREERGWRRTRGITSEHSAESGGEMNGSPIW